MKTKRSKNKLLVSFSKQTIANLNHREIADVRGKENFPDNGYDEQLSDATVVLEALRGCTPGTIPAPWWDTIFQKLC